MINKELNSVLKNIEQSNGLPNKNYIDNKQYDVEKRVLIFDQWAGVMVADEIPEPGDAKPLTFIDIPLLLLRNEKNEIKVFLNVCRHRGMILIKKAKKIEGAIRCPYHSWCYSKNGDLISTPHVGGPGKNLPSKYSTLIVSKPFSICKVSEEDKTCVLPSIFAWAIEQSKSSKIRFLSKPIEALNFSINGLSQLSNLLLQTFAISVINIRYI